MDSNNRDTSLEIIEGDGLLYHFDEFRLFRKGAVSIKKVSYKEKIMNFELNGNFLLS